MSKRSEHVETVVIGGGQSGLVVGYHLAKQGSSFVILDAASRTGASWRSRWDSLRLFTPNRFNGLPGMRFPGAAHVAPTKDQMADYLEAYATQLELPIRHEARVHAVAKTDDRFIVATNDGVFTAENVVIASGPCHDPYIPEFAPKLDPAITQLHSAEYRDPSQLRPGGVLLVGAGNSGADISLEVVKTHPTWLAGRDVGAVPFRIDTYKARVLIRLVRFVGHRVITLGTPIGRKAIPNLTGKGDTLIRVKPKDIVGAGIKRVPRVAGVRRGLPLLEDGEVLDVTNVIWCTGFRPDYSWIELPILGDDGRPQHDRGVVMSQPGLYFAGLEFQYAATSGIITGVDRDAEHVVKHLSSRMDDMRLAERSKPLSARSERSG